MNERIKELAEQAKLNPVLLLQHWGTIDALTDSEQESLERIEKFAELIIRECVSTVESVPSGFIDYRSQIEVGMRDYCVEVLKNHFGVK